MSARFALAPAHRSFVIRRSLSFIATGALLFFGTLIASRLRPSPLLFWLGALGAGFLVWGIRSFLLRTRPLLVGDHAVWVAGRGHAFGNIDAVEVKDGALLVHLGRRVLRERLDEPAMAAAEIARRAGLRPPQRGVSGRWERRRMES